MLVEPPMTTKQTRITNPRILAWLNEGLLPHELLDLQNTFNHRLAGYYVANTAGKVSGVVKLISDGSYEALAGLITKDSLLFYLDPVQSKKSVQIGCSDWDYYITSGKENLGPPKNKSGTLEELAAGKSQKHLDRKAKMDRSKKAATRYPEETKAAAIELFLRGVKIATVQAKFGIDRATAYRWRKSVIARVSEQVRQRTL